MTIAQSMLAEFETQAPIPQRFLERLPEDKLTWKPHEKSMSAGQLAYHLAFIPGGAIRFVQNNPHKRLNLPTFRNLPAARKSSRPLTKVSPLFATCCLGSMMPA